MKWQNLIQKKACGNSMKFEPGRLLNVDPYASYRFNAVIDGLKVAGFNEVSGLSFESEIETFREGGANAHVRQLAGPFKSSGNLTLKRGLTGNKLWTWYQEAMSGQQCRKPQIMITLQNYAGEDVADWQWVFKDVYPAKWTGPQFRAGTAEIAFETIELIHRGLLIT
jgi:phage tail-like protein